MNQIRVTCKTYEDYQNVKCLLERQGYDIYYESGAIEEVSFVVNKTTKTAKTVKDTSGSYWYSADEFFRQENNSYAVTIVFDENDKVELFESGKPAPSSHPAYRAKMAGIALAEYFDQSGCYCYTTFLGGVEEYKLPKKGDLARFKEDFLLSLPEDDNLLDGFGDSDMDCVCNAKAKIDEIIEESNFDDAYAGDIMFRTRIDLVETDRTKTFSVLASDDKYCLISADEVWMPVYLVERQNLIKC